MKNIDLKIYSEKLKINPVSLNDFDKCFSNVDNNNYKNQIKTFDIVKMKYGYYYMVFLSNDIHEYLNNVLRLNIIFGDEKYYESIFFWAEPAETHFMTFDRYNDDLSHMRYNTWNITEIYKCPNNFVLKLDAKELNQHTLKDIIIEEKYLKIK